MGRRSGTLGEGVPFHQRSAQASASGTNAVLTAGETIEVSEEAAQGFALGAPGPVLLRCRSRRQ